jgi:hypothetical protein
MGKNERADALRRGLAACIVGDAGVLAEVFHDDVVGWSPNMLVNSLAELTEAVADRDGSLSDVTLEINSLDILGNKGFVEYRISAVFSGPFVIDDATVIEPNGRTILLGAALVAEFTEDKISAFRNYFDDATLMEQMLYG